MVCLIHKSEREWLSMFNILFTILLKVIKYRIILTPITSININNESVILNYFYNMEENK